MRIQKLFIFIFIAMMYGCSSKEHLKFNNIPIDGHPDKFAGQLTKSGFIISDSTSKNEISLKGRFLNKECMIKVFGTTKSDLVYKVNVSLPEEIHDSLQFGFDRIQKQFNLIYGPGTSRYQKYKKRERLLYNVPGLAREIREGDFTRYTTDSGEVLLEVREGYLSVTYTDKINSEMLKTEMGPGH